MAALTSSSCSRFQLLLPQYNELLAISNEKKIKEVESYAPYDRLSTVSWEASASDRKARDKGAFQIPSWQKLQQQFI